MREFRILQGDVLAVLRTLEPNYFDACLCNPPYSLSFMGKEWDHGVPATETWAALLRVLKPDAILLAFGGARTHHRLMVAIEDAGFEVRDCCMWLYASGFPKSLDISRVIDKAAGVTREVLPNTSSKRNRQTMGRPEHSGSGFQENPVLTAPATDAARQWDGYGTALKPAWEPIIVAMKPCEGTLAQNALKWGVAGLAIDEARIECDGESLSGGGSTVGKKFENHHEGWARPWMADDDAREASRALRAEAEVHAELLGRWPANVLLDFESAAMPDEASGDLSSGFMSAGTPRNNRAGYNGAMPPNTAALEIYGDSRGASRYFYVAKADSAERHAGGKNQHPCVKPVDL